MIKKFGLVVAIFVIRLVSAQSRQLPLQRKGIARF